MNKKILKLEVNGPVQVDIYRGKDYVGHAYLIHPDMIAARARYFPGNPYEQNYYAKIQLFNPKYEATRKINQFYVHNKFDPRTLQQNAAVVKTDQPFDVFYKDEQSGFRSHFTHNELKFLQAIGEKYRGNYKC
ncbi:uncharacterized protein LOC117171571 [Belonocnema kinseyi]|uniref:uncharacterized protein LOC117171571 n=1 Tax=Belonocnema kinseyi TaxID=2817044 RepID=UPI00143D0FAC|nr:uncharacterized protein LOC117171571 [Belonocnema kinseyi]XP_033214898.1 uncharacterized protein LOC117171571 [Belonocnema kinseyi]